MPGGGEPPCTPTTLLVGGQDVTNQGWQMATQAPFSLTYETAVTRLVTNSDNTGGMLLLGHAVTAGPLDLLVTLQIDAVNTHNQYDAAVAIMGGYSGGFGLPDERAHMIYLDGNSIGWADNSQSVAVNLLDGAVHDVELIVDGSGNATVYLDDVSVLTRTGFTLNGSIAVGDQTNDPGVNSNIRLHSVSLQCPS